MVGKTAAHSSARTRYSWQQIANPGAILFPTLRPCHHWSHSQWLSTTGAAFSDLLKPMAHLPTLYPPPTRRPHLPATPTMAQLATQSASTHSPAYKWGPITQLKVLTHKYKTLLYLPITIAGPDYITLSMRHFANRSASAAATGNPAASTARRRESGFEVDEVAEIIFILLLPPIPSMFPAGTPPPPR